MAEMNEQLYRQVSDSIKLVFDLTSRIDERVKMLVEQHSEVNQRIEKIMERHESILARISVLETKGSDGMKEDLADLKKSHHETEIKVAALELTSRTHDNKWQMAGDFVFKLALAIIGGIIAWNLGIK